MIKKLVPIEHKNQRILTTQQLAEFYETDTQVITNNFNRNKERYDAGKHYYALIGNEKTLFLNQTQIDLGLKHAQTIYLWTKKGAFLHAKSLNTDRAWEVYDELVESYFREQFIIPQTRAEALRLAADLEEQNMQLQEQLQIVAPKVELAKRITESKNSILIRDYAKVLCKDGFNIGEKRLYQYLRDNKILTVNNLPYQRFVDMKIFEVIERPIQMAEGTQLTFTTMITPKGQEYLFNRLKRDSYGLETKLLNAIN